MRSCIKHVEGPTTSRFRNSISVHIHVLAQTALFRTINDV